MELIAHRAGNQPWTVAPAAEVATTVEADVHRFRRRTEVRHAKVVWPFRIHWDKWWLDVSPDEPPELSRILAELPRGTGVWLDLKSPSTRLTQELVAAVPDSGRLTMSSRLWPVLRPARRAGVRTMRSVGSRWQLQALRCVRRWSASDGIVIDQRLVDAHTLRWLRGRAPSLVVWGVVDVDRADELVGGGVDGLIIDDLDLIRAIREGSAEAGARPAR